MDKDGQAYQEVLAKLNIQKNLGVELLTRVIANQKQLDTLISDYDGWKTMIGSELGNISEQEAKWWHVLGLMPSKPFPHALNSEHQRYLRIVAERIVRLEAVIEVYGDQSQIDHGPSNDGIEWIWR